jgi:hypothetical protein
VISDGTSGTDSVRLRGCSVWRIASVTSLCSWRSYADPIRDQAAGQSLMRSDKDRHEHKLVTDAMRHTAHRIGHQLMFMAIFVRAHQALACGLVTDRIGITAGGAVADHHRNLMASRHSD